MVNSTPTASSVNDEQKVNLRLAQALIISLFFLWALTSNLIPVLIPHLKKACQLTDIQSAFIDSAYWIAYFLMAIPASWLMRKYSYKFGIVLGLIIAASGAFLFYPAAEVRTFAFFLFALFLVASGMTFLETAANPYMTVLGSAETSVQRLNFAQAFNGLGAFISAFFISKWILSGKELSQEVMNSMSSDQLSAYLDSEVKSLQLPYVLIAVVLIIVALAIIATRFPQITEEEHHKSAFHLGVFRHRHFKWGVIAQFAYVGAQVCISSFFIRYVKFSAGIPELEATNFLGLLLLGFMVGRFVGTYIMKLISPAKLLQLYSLVNMALLGYCVLVGGSLSVYALIAVEFFMSIMFPTIFSLAIRDLGHETKSASAFMVMSIIGGAIIPVMLGMISQAYNIQNAYVIPLGCFGFVFYYGWRGHQINLSI